MLAWLVILPALTGWGQIADSIAPASDLSQMQTLRNHHPKWASAANDQGLVPAGQVTENLTLVLARSPQQQQAFERFLKDQQNSASPEYHHWLTPAEVGNRFGLSVNDVETIKGWLTSQGLHVNWIAPSRIFIGIGGTAGVIGRAFQTELHYYKVDGEQRMSVSSDPMIPQALAPVIKAIRGLYSIEEKAAHHAVGRQLSSPEGSNGNTGNNYIAPADFANIYDLPSAYSGAGFTIGIVGRSRTDMDDFSNFMQRTRTTFQNPTEVIPTAYGGVDPGPAQTAEGSTYSDDQFEATLDVTRAGSVAPGAQLLLVVSTITTNATSGVPLIVAGDSGLDAAAEYLVQSMPIPAQVMTISFGSCESNEGSPGVSFWDGLFSQAAMEGISVFVSSGDSGAAGCDASKPPLAPDTPDANSPNGICSSSYATCVGGTEFNDTSDPSAYWNTAQDSAGLPSALSYIPEGGWNESSASSSAMCGPAVGPCVQSSGGGVSSIITIPDWQMGVNGVPGANTGRFTPDISFSASGHDAYFLCFVANGGSCVSSADGTYFFTPAAGTSAAAPSMAGVAALLDQKMGSMQGNLNPAIYATYSSAPAAFHDVTVTTSGATSCSVSTLSMCNNSTPTGLGGVQAGYLVGSGFDEVTGLGSLDVSNFINGFTPATTSGFTLSATPATLTVTQGSSGTSTVTVADIGGFSGPVVLSASGLPNGVTSSFASGSVAGTQVLTLTASASAAAASTPVPVTITGTSGTLTASTMIALTIAGQPSFMAVTGGTTSITISPGATTGNTATVSMVGTNGFAGSVNLTCAVTTALTNVKDMPTCSLNPSSVMVSGTVAQTSMLTVTTNAASTAENQMKKLFGQLPDGMALALVLVFSVPSRRRRNWMAMMGGLFLICVFMGATGCGGSNPTPPPPTGGNSGTTTGTYTITVTGTSGTINATVGTITLTVQ